MLKKQHDVKYFNIEEYRIDKFHCNFKIRMLYVFNMSGIIKAQMPLSDEKS